MLGSLSLLGLLGHPAMNRRDYYRNLLAVTTAGDNEASEFSTGWWTMWIALARLWSDDRGQDIAEYAVMLAVILVIVVGTVRLIGSNANTVFSEVASSVQ